MARVLRRCQLRLSDSMILALTGALQLAAQIGRGHDGTAKTLGEDVSRAFFGDAGELLQLDIEITGNFFQLSDFAFDRCYFNKVGFIIFNL